MTKATAALFIETATLAVTVSLAANGMWKAAAIIGIVRSVWLLFGIVTLVARAGK